MTLVLTLIRPEGVWQSADNRVTRAGVVRDDRRPKHLHLIFPPLPGGPQMLLAFTGLAELVDGTPTQRWIRETIRGEPRAIMPTLDLLRDRLTRDVGGSSRWREPLGIVGAVIDGDKRFLVEIHNLRPDGQIVHQFEYVVVEVTEPEVFLAGGGASAVSPADVDLMRRQVGIRPAKWEDHAGLLAAVNRRAAQVSERRAKRGKVGVVSPWCQVTYLSSESEGARGRHYTEPGESPHNLSIETVLAGLDLSETSAHFFAAVQEGRVGEPAADAETINRGLQPRL